MNTAELVDKKIKEWKESGVERSKIAWDAALLCVGWAYVFGARGQYCTPANRRARYSDAHPTIKTACKNYNGSSSSGCTGCKWYPNSKYTRFFDCRGFTYWVLKQAYDGWELVGQGCTSQWNNDKNWKAKGEISTMPKNTLCCLFVQKGNTMEHTGFGLNNETVECSSGVQYFSSRKSKWTHWAVPVVVDAEIPDPGPAPEPDPPTLRRGSKGAYVRIAQQLLQDLGYDLGVCGVDGDFGKATEAAVKQFQKDWGLDQDGVIGKKTWDLLRTAPPKEKKYVVTIPNLDLTQAKAICNNYPGSTYKEM